MKLTYIPILLLFVLLLASCSEEMTEKTLFVNAISITCTEGAAPCLQVRETPDTSWSFYQGNIEGFEFVEGNTYELRVGEIADAAAPGGFRLKLLQVVNQETSPVWSGPPPTTLEASWYVQAMGSPDSLHTLLGNSSIMGEFFAEKSQINGVAGCNRYFASYEVNGDQITFQKPGATRMMCYEPEGIMEQEGEFLRLLEQGNRYQINNGQLTIFCNGGEKIIFKGR